MNNYETTDYEYVKNLESRIYEAQEIIEKCKRVMGGVATSEMEKEAAMIMIEDWLNTTVDYEIA